VGPGGARGRQTLSVHFKSKSPPFVTICHGQKLLYAAGIGCIPSSPLDLPLVAGLVQSRAVQVSFTKRFLSNTTGDRPDPSPRDTDGRVKATILALCGDLSSHPRTLSLKFIDTSFSQ